MTSLILQSWSGPEKGEHRVVKEIAKDKTTYGSTIRLLRKKEKKRESRWSIDGQTTLAKKRKRGGGGRGGVAGRVDFYSSRNPSFSSFVG